MRSVVEAYLEAYNRFDVEGMLRLMAPSVVFENYSGGILTARTEGIDQLGSMARQSAALFSERTQTLLSYTGSDTAGTARIRFEATLAVDLEGVGGAGTRMSLEGRSDFRFAGVRISYLADFS